MSKYIENRKSAKSAIQVCVDDFFSRSKYKNADGMLYKKIMQHARTCDLNYEMRYPFFLDWKIVSSCNLRCKHCFFEGCETKFDYQNDLSTEKALSLADELSDLGVVQVRLTGGEPLLRADIFEVIKKLKSRNVSISISTNATLVTKVIAKKLADLLNPLTDSIQVSLDGAKRKTHEIIRGSKTFDRAIKGISLLVQNGIPLYLNSVVTSLNVNEVADLYLLAVQLKTKKISFSKLIIMNDGQKNLIPDADILFESIARTIEIEKKGEDPYLELLIFKEYDFVNNDTAKSFLNNYIQPQSELLNSKHSFKCHFGQKSYIDSDGTVYPCSLAVGLKTFELGNVKNDSFENIWSKRGQNVLLKERFSKNMLCQKCKYVSICRGGCPARAYQKYGDTNAPDSSCFYGQSLQACENQASPICPK